MTSDDDQLRWPATMTSWRMVWHTRVMMTAVVMTGLLGGCCHHDAVATMAASTLTAAACPREQVPSTRITGAAHG
eukprot:CAMPEP_0185437782 /NCGR_PEP_ID=MMETSP1365-20130426/32588_1 /TAXON_ID=38817 /ORGANISM="Gephyrocapsa oceanica, Strain RCC1303" /LENGTH=74 /DNA_ID=CAMNT_0028042859 /DNA_START=56 /DNA_END=277 /DNA_ORIENTATION=-